MASEPFALQRALDRIAAGGLVVLAADDDPAGEAVLAGRADLISAEAMAFVVRHTSGLVCVAMDPARLDALRLGPMVADPTHPMGMIVAVSVDAADTSTGMSAAERARTANLLAAPDAVAGDFRRPGHVFPLRIAPGGVIELPGYAEAAADLARLSGGPAAGVLCGLASEDRVRMSRLEEAADFARANDLPVVTIAELVAHRRRSERTLERAASAWLPTPLGTFRCVGYEPRDHRATGPLALVHGEVAGEEPVLVAVHRQHLLGELFGVAGGGEELDATLQALVGAGAGVLVYLRGGQDSGHALVRELVDRRPGDRRPALAPAGPSDDTGIAAQVLADLGVRRIRLLDADADPALEGFGIELVSGRRAA